MFYSVTKGAGFAEQLIVGGLETVRDWHEFHSVPMDSAHLAAPVCPCFLPRFTPIIPTRQTQKDQPPIIP